MPRRATSLERPRRKVRPVHVVALGVLIGLVALVSLIRFAPPADPNAEFVSDSPPPRDPPPGMVWIPEGRFQMGSRSGAPDESPPHLVRVDGFWMDRTEVTNEQFEAFVKQTGYVTTAERVPEAAKYPDADPQKLVPGSAVFVQVDCSTDPRDWPNPSQPPWWKYVPGACWRHPEGPGSSIEAKKQYPVVHITWDDAVAYCNWAGKRLPTEAEWEYAARGGLKRQEFCWGSARQGEGGTWFANTFQGRFPAQDTGEDGFVGVAPVAGFPPNGFGLHDMSGNVWEWCQDYYDSGYYDRSSRDNPKGPEMSEPDERGQSLRVRRGGSYLCADGYCRRYLPSARDKNPADSGASHTGFRCVKDK